MRVNMCLQRDWDVCLFADGKRHQMCVCVHGMRYREHVRGDGNVENVEGRTGAREHGHFTSFEVIEKKLCVACSDGTMFVWGLKESDPGMFGKMSRYEGVLPKGKDQKIYCGVFGNGGRKI